MIPSSTCSTSDSTENVPTNSLAMQWGDKEEKQMIVNNYYIKEQTGGWKQVKQSEISPNISRTRAQTKNQRDFAKSNNARSTNERELEYVGRKTSHIQSRTLQHA